ncbi:malto-oligosyltrehalose trehalohydrolase [Acidianus sp. DSM 29099]|nr:malto-oligosyltrehalose trehalohydrolase [Acidianus sp. RZ1]NON63297.1 malto-oligosyltrehalose trehalohydrolase [Acidianus sp. RZ1]
MWKLDIGANLEENEVKFRVWAPFLKSLKIKVNDREFDLEEEEKGYFSTYVKAKEGDRYGYLFNGNEIPDPVSRFQPEGVHKKSEIVSPNFNWEDKNWKGIEMPIIYEMHVGAFGNDFYGVAKKIPYLRELGITAIELMPVSQFAGNRNWGYDGVMLYAVQNSYGGPKGLKYLVNEAHKNGIGVIIDVVYNHIGPEGNYLGLFGPYFSSRYKTPWGPIFNFDESWSDEVRHYVIQNVLYWINEYHADGLRLDAVHSIYDMSPKHILREIMETVEKNERKAIIIAESDLNDPRIILPPVKCGYGLDAQWSDDLHHAIHAFFTGERDSYYEDFGEIEKIAKALKDVFVYDGVYSKFRKKTHGFPVGNLPGNKFVVYCQNHDQVGNRLDGKRIISLVGKEKAKMLPFLYLLSPYIPMLFMGEEYGEENPFLFFTDFSDAEIIKGLREGRKKEMGKYYYEPQSEETFNRSKLSWKIDEELLGLYKALISLRKGEMRGFSRDIEVKTNQGGIIYTRGRYIIVIALQKMKVEYKGELIISTNSKCPQKIPAEVEGCAAVYKYNE